MSERNQPALTPGAEHDALPAGAAPSALPAAERHAALGGQSRRALLAGAGAVGAAVVLSACGGSDDSAGTGGPDAARPPATGGGNATPGAGGLIGTAEIPEGGGRIIADAAVVITQPQPGEFKAFDFTCTHQRCPVSRVADGKILCTCHNSAFSISDGSPVSGPATRPLAAKEILVEGDRISLA